MHSSAVARQVGLVALELRLDRLDDRPVPFVQTAQRGVRLLRLALHQEELLRDLQPLVGRLVQLLVERGEGGLQLARVGAQERHLLEEPFGDLLLQVGERRQLIQALRGRGRRGAHAPALIVQTRLHARHPFLGRGAHLREVGLQPLRRAALALLQGGRDARLVLLLGRAEAPFDLLQ